MSSPTRPDQHPDPDKERRETDRAAYRAMLQDMMRTGMAIVRTLEQRAATATPDDTDTPVQIAGAYDRVTRAIRRNIMLATRLDEPERAPRAPKSRADDALLDPVARAAYLDAAYENDEEDVDDFDEDDDHDEDRPGTERLDTERLDTERLDTDRPERLDPPRRTRARKRYREDEFLECPVYNYGIPTYPKPTNPNRPPSSPAIPATCREPDD